MHVRALRFKLEPRARATLANRPVQISPLPSLALTAVASGQAGLRVSRLASRLPRAAPSQAVALGYGGVMAINVDTEQAAALACFLPCPAKG